METLLALVPYGITAFFKLGTTLGCGMSTATVAAYLVAQRDGTIDTNERSILGILYTTLRVAMVLVISSLLAITGFMWWYGDTSLFTSPVFLFQIGLTAVLILNAVLMTKHLIPKVVGPSVQAATWYSFFLLDAMPVGDLSLVQLTLGYAAFTCLVFATIASLMPRATGSTSHIAAPPTV
jgi:hypothetical protein